jgi:non-ribosomal peptide synthetase component F
VTRTLDHPPAGWNATDRPFRSDAVISELVIETARRAPDAPAVVTGERTVYTYGDLLAHANQLARLLVDELGVGVGDHVGVAGRSTVAGEPDGVRVVLHPRVLPPGRRGRPG